MKGFVFFLLLFFNTSLFAQDQKIFDFELALNHSIVFNKGEFRSQQNFSGFGFFRDTIYGEKPTRLTNFNASIGVHLNSDHGLRLRYSQRKIGATLSGVDDFSQFYYQNLFNEVGIKAVGLIYDFSRKTKNGGFLLSVGIERQKVIFADTRIFFNGMGFTNYASYLAIGYQEALLDNLFLMGRIYNINSFRNDSIVFQNGIESEYIPIQYGLEVGLRLEFGDW